jgi:hypothetical protein
MGVKETGRDYEIIVKAIYEALLQSSEVKNLRIEHDVILQGTKTNHRIDVYWEFSIADQIYRTIVEVKKHKGRAKQKDLMAFDTLLKDVPGQPRGIFITKSGYQSGAIRFAENSGISLMHLIKVPEDADYTLKMTAGSWCLFQVISERLVMRMTVRGPKLANPKLSVCEEWLIQQGGDFRAKLFDRMMAAKFYMHEVIFSDESRNNKLRLWDVVQDRLKTVHSGFFPIRLEFEEPTFVHGLRYGENNIAMEGVKITKFEVMMAVEETTMERPLFSEPFSVFLLKKAVEDNGRYVLIEKKSADIRAIVRLTGTRRAIT